MRALDDFDTDTERRFALYLNSRGFNYQREPDIGGVHPDFFVATPWGAVVCEVKEFEQPDPLPSGATDAYGFIRVGLQGKIRQGRGAKGKYPYVVVLGRQGLGPGPLDHISVPGAMFGNAGITFRIDPSTGGAANDPPKQTFLGGGRLQVERNTRVSAVLVVRGFNPTLRAVQDAIHSRSAERDEEEGVRIIFDTFEEFTADGRFDEGALEYRAVVYHNYFADIPLPYAVFSAVCDDQYGLLGSQYMLVAQGVKVPALPE